MLPTASLLISDVALLHALAFLLAPKWRYSGATHTLSVKNMFFGERSVMHVEVAGGRVREIVLGHVGVLLVCACAEGKVHEIVLGHIL